MKKIPCYLCGSEEKEVICNQNFKDDYLSLINADLNKIQRSLVVCKTCAFIYRDPQLEDFELKTLYLKFRDSSIRGESPDQYFDRITQLEPHLSENYEKVSWINERIEGLNFSNKKILDIGCGGGVFLYEFLRQNPLWSATGVEPTISFAELAERRLGCNIYKDSYRSEIVSDGIETKKFDLISLNQVLEHVSDPIKFMLDLKNNLNLGGVIYVEVPHISDLISLPLDHDRFLSQHLWIFSEISFTNVMQRSGLSIKNLEVVETIRGKKNLVALLELGGDECEEILREDYKKIINLQKTVSP